MGKHQSVNLIDILNDETGYVYVREERYTADIFLEFLKNVLKQYLTGKSIMREFITLKSYNLFK